MSLELIHSESFFAVINKPAGLFTQAAPGIPCVECELLAQFQATTPGAQPYVAFPHRLDRGTSGVLLVARNQRSIKRLGEQFHSRKVSKRYLALVEGTPTENSATWEDYVRKIDDRPVAEIVSADSEGAKLAQLRYELLASDGEKSLLAIELYTGRMHQIRLQASHRGFPVVGDWSYGSAQTWGELDSEGNRCCFALHAASIRFRHPQTAKEIGFIAPLPPIWKQQLSDEMIRAAERYSAAQILK